MNNTLMIASSWILLLFLGLSIFDGLYYHLWKFRLQERNDSKFEHITHTLRAILFIPTVILIYWTGVSGMALWSAIVVLAFDLITEVVDVLEERASRATLGGLPSGEYLVHIMLTTLRVSALALAFAALPSEAWLLNSADVVVPSFSKFVALQTLPGAILVAGLHIYLIFDPTFVSRMERSLRNKCCPQG
ncbi:hypothetical protein [Bdellovibrio bacteriovorus]|uniref:hypothetical protein n=1 Tax=Bdellovibrio bacteriovorus TaxID=959 RepID=UPI003D084530